MVAQKSMKNIFTLFVYCFVVFCFALNSTNIYANADKGDLSLEERSSQKNLTPKFRTWETDAGVRVIIYEIKSIPLIDLAIDIDAGSRWDPKGLEGLSAMTESMIFKGTDAYNGQEEMSEQQIAEFIAKTALIKSSSNDRDKTSLRFRFLSDMEIRDSVLEFISRVLAFPEINNEILEREKNNTISRLEESLTKPQSIAIKSLWKSMYPDHPYGNSISSQSISSISEKDLMGFHQTFWTPERVTLSIVGNINFADAKNLANKIMGPLSKKSPVNSSSSSFQFQQLLPPVTLGGKIVKKISHPAAQSHIWMGLPVLARHETDHIFPMLVANHILGGSGFGSRLTKEIREERGLSYSVFSAFSLLKQKGPFFIGLQTGKENSDEAIEVMVNTVSEYIKNGPSEEELEIAKQGIVGGFALRLDSNSKILENLAQIVFYDLPLDYLDNWTLRIQAVTLDDVKKVLKERVDLNSSSLIVVGYKE